MHAGGFVSVFIRMSLVSHMRRLMFVQLQFCPAALCRQSPSPVSACNPGSQIFFPCWEDSCLVAEGSISLTTGLLSSLDSDLVFAGDTGVGRVILPLRVLGPGLLVLFVCRG